MGLEKICLTLDNVPVCSVSQTYSVVDTFKMEKSILLYFQDEHFKCPCQLQPWYAGGGGLENKQTNKQKTACENENWIAINVRWPQLFYSSYTQ